MRSLLSIVSSAKVNRISWPLRSSVRSPESSRFLASCWVMVEPPTTLGARDAARAACVACAQGGRRLHHHPATGQEPAALVRANAAAQGPGNHPRLPAGADVEQGADPGDLPEPVSYTHL